MHRRETWCTLIILAALAVVFAMPARAMALTLRQGDTVAVTRGEVLVDDVYAFGSTITIDGTVDGDVVAFGQSVVITGEVRGSVIAAAQTIRIDGTVDGSVRAAGATVDVSGVVGGDLLAAGQTVTVTGDVKRDLAAAASDVSLPGIVGRKVMTSSASLVISGSVGGDVEAQTPRVTVTPEGIILGDLDYWSADDARIEGSVSGTTLRHEPPTTEKESSGAAGVASSILGAILAWVQSFIGFLLLGLLMVFALRGPVLRGSQAAFDRLLPSLGVGLLVFFGTPMAAGFVFLVGLFVGAWWLAFVMLTIYWLLFVAGIVVGSVAVGRAILRKASATGEPAPAWSLVLGLAVVWVTSVVPVLGWLAAWAVMLTGAGALILVWMGKGEKPAVAASVPAPVAPAPKVGVS